MLSCLGDISQLLLISAKFIKCILQVINFTVKVLDKILHIKQQTLMLLLAAKHVISTESGSHNNCMSCQRRDTVCDNYYDNHHLANNAY